MSDLISRQDAIDAVFELSDKLANEMLFIDAIVDEIENLPSAETERKWIPASERLPEEDTEVLVTVHFDGTKDVPPSNYVEIAGQIDGYWVSDSDEYKVARSRHHVIAWKPLPEPWRGKK